MKRAHGQMSESLLLGAMLAMAGGFFDAYTYLCRGKVFANAQTGNIVLFSANIAEGNWLRAAEYFLPILAFALGVVAAEIVKRRYKKRQSDINIHWRQIVVLVEIVLLITAAFLPQTLNTTVNIMISFICAMQVESFRKVRGSQINDLVVGDLCHQTTGLQLFVQSHRNILLFCGAEKTKTPSAKHQFGRGREIFAVPPLFAASSQKRPHECTPQSRVTLLRL